MPRYHNDLNKLFSLVIFSCISFLYINQAMENPGLARQYNVSCSMCHVAFSKLNTFGQEFVGNGMRIDSWQGSATTDTGDKRLDLLKSPPVAFRAQAFAQV